MKTAGAKVEARRLLEENKAFSYRIPPNVLELYEKQLGKQWVDSMKAGPDRAVPPKPGAVLPARPGPGDARGPERVQEWPEVSRSMGPELSEAVTAFFDQGRRFTPEQVTRLRELHRQSGSQRDFLTWLGTTLRQRWEGHKTREPAGVGR